MDPINYARDNETATKEHADTNSSVSTTSKRVVDKCHKVAQRDSFSDLTGLMKAKVPYTPTLQAAPKLQPKLDLATSGEIKCNPHIEKYAERLQSYLCPNETWQREMLLHNYVAHFKPIALSPRFSMRSK